MKRVTKAQWDKWYEDNVTASLDRTPKWNGRESSITWKWISGKKAGKIVLAGDQVAWYLAE